MGSRELIVNILRNQESRSEVQVDWVSQNLEASLNLAMSGSPEDSQKIAELNINELKTIHINLKLRLLKTGSKWKFFIDRNF